MRPEPSDLDEFRAWLIAHGANVLNNLSPWEILRWQDGTGIVSVYQNARGGQTWTGRAGQLRDAWRKGHSPKLSPVATVRLPSTLRKFASVLADRDGWTCWFCGGRLPPLGDPCDPSDAPSVEHLVPVAHGGPNHVSNLVLAHAGCNQRAGNVSVAEKVRMREAMMMGAPR